MSRFNFGMAGTKVIRILNYFWSRILFWCFPHCFISACKKKMWKNVLLFHSDISIQMDLTSFHLSQHKSEFFHLFMKRRKKSFHKPIELKSFIIFILSMLKKCAKSSDDGNFFSFQNCMNNRENFGTVWWIMNWARKLWKVMIFSFCFPPQLN